jgi:carotenoid cleavage dioxygenase-like enzyme
LSSCSGFFINFHFGNRFSVKEREVNKALDYILPEEKQKVINKINGIFAIIGPDVDFKNVSNLFDLFTGDGVIQSVFFDNGKITYVKHYVRTEKLLYEEKNGIFPKHLLLRLLFLVMHKMNIMPNILGVANTALLNVNNKIYALNERDMPYLLDVNFKEKKINTIRKTNIPFMNYFSAHSKYNKSIDSIEYNIVTNSVKYHELTENLELIKQKTIKTNYLPIIHDFLKVNDKILITDSPIVINLKDVFNKSMPVQLANHKPTFIRILDKNTMKIDNYVSPVGFYIFHYADYRENDKTIEVYAALYNELDFSQLNIIGKYRKLILNKETKLATIVKNEELEKLDLEFPIKFGDKIVFRKIEDKRINGFVVCKGLEVIKKIEFENKFFSGEPAIHYVENIPYLITFAFNDNSDNEGYIMVINMNTYEEITISINEQLSAGFHSIFIDAN